MKLCSNKQKLCEQQEAALEALPLISCAAYFAVCPPIQ
jgi:hypothetical protein